MLNTDECPKCGGSARLKQSLDSIKVSVAKYYCPACEGASDFEVGDAVRASSPNWDTDVVGEVYRIYATGGFSMCGMMEAVDGTSTGPPQPHLRVSRDGTVVGSPGASVKKDGVKMRKPSQ